MKHILLFVAIIAGVASFGDVMAQGDCNLDVSIDNQGCGVFVLTASNYEDNAMLNWYLGGELYQSDVNIVTILFETNDPAQVCVSYTTDLCMEGVEWCETLTPTLCNDCPEDTFMGAGEVCGCYSFEIGSFVDGEAVTWNFGDGTVVEGGHFIEHCFEEDGNYTVTAAYSSPVCEGAEYTLGVAEVNCGTTCTEIALGMDSNVGNGGPTFVNWFIYDEVAELMANGVCQYNLETAFCDAMACLEDGCYTFEVTSDTPIDNADAFTFSLGEAADIVGEPQYIEFEGGYQWVVDFGVNSACGPCPIDGTMDFQGGSSYLFTVDVPDGVVVSWYIDGTYMEQGTAYDYTFDPGTYVVCASYETELCPEGVEFCFDVVVEATGCPEDSGFVALADCGCFGFEVGSFVEGESVNWLASDGTEYNDAGHYQQFCFQENGTYTVTADYSSPVCEGETYTFVVEVDCFIECTEVNFGFDSDVAEGGPFNVQYIVKDAEGETWTSGACGYTGDIDNCDVTTCLPVGCYTVDLYSIDPMNNTNNFTAGVYINGSLVPFQDDPIFDGNYHMQFTFSVGGGCEATACELGLSYGQFSGLNYNFVAEPSDPNADITWTFSDGGSSTGGFVSYTFAEAGEYEVCASYTTEFCPDGVEECVIVYVEEEACQFVTVSVEADFSGLDADLIEFVLESEGISVDGQWELVEGMASFVFDFCLPDGCYSLTLDPMAALAASFIDFSITDAEGNNIGTLEFSSGDDGALTIEFGVNENCSDNIQEVAQGQMELFPNPAFDQVTIYTPTLKGQKIYRIFDISGKLVMEGNFTGETRKISVTSLSSGVYTLKVTNSDAEHQQRLVIQ
ncbi:MAG: T9SS type A sorting domain-containing protein [Flavobacteriales bacterium]|nr:T9SS type A sorting domain-containing protein [Flavobacteriales bacterium]